MNCPTCGYRYQEDEISCLRCGALLSVTTEELERVERYRLTQNRDLLSMLFVDISGFTGIANRSLVMSQKILVLHETLVTTIVERDNAGEVVNMAGDGLLAVFSNPAVAIERALEMQETVAQYHQGILPNDYRSWALAEVDLPTRPAPEDDHYQIHIGANLGLVTRGGRTSRDIFGHNVNVTCRLCTLAGKGQIYMTETVYDNARLILGERDDLDWEIWKDVPIRGLTEPVTIVALTQRPYHTITRPRISRFQLRSKNRLVRNLPILLVSALAVIFAVALALVSLRHFRTPRQGMVATAPSLTPAGTPPVAVPPAALQEPAAGPPSAPVESTASPGGNLPPPIVTAPSSLPLPQEIEQFKLDLIKSGEPIQFMGTGTKMAANLATAANVDGILIAVGTNGQVSESAEMGLWIDGDGDNAFQTQKSAPYTDLLVRVQGPVTRGTSNLVALVAGKAADTLPAVDGLAAVSRRDSDWTTWLFRLPYTALGSERRRSLNYALQFWPAGPDKEAMAYPGGQGELRKLSLPE